jgi:hypothetical protein
VNSSGGSSKKEKKKQRKTKKKTVQRKCEEMTVIISLGPGVQGFKGFFDTNHIFRYFS